jgi:hypothetical protein
VKSFTYDTVTAVPVLIPAHLLPSERAHGLDTFRLRLPGIYRPAVVGQKWERPAPWIAPQEHVIALAVTDLSRTSRLGRAIWQRVGADFQNDLRQVLALHALSNSRKSTAIMTKMYRDMERQIWGITDSELFPPSRLKSLAKSGLSKYFYPGKRASEFASCVTANAAHKNVVAGLISNRLNDTRIVLWWIDDRLLPAIWCENLESAVTVLCLPIFAGGKLLGLCPWCRQIFVRERTDQKHCCERHSEAERVARWRAKNKRDNSRQMRHTRRTDRTARNTTVKRQLV